MNNPNTSPYYIKKVSPNLFDLFVGKGWDNWSRFQADDKGIVSLVKGKPLSKQIVDFIRVHYLKIKEKV